MEIIINKPQTTEGKKELEKNLAKFQAILMIQKIKQLNYSDVTKKKLLNLILEKLKAN